MSNDRDAQSRTNPDSSGKPVSYKPPGWLSTDGLEQELFLAVVTDSNDPRAEGNFQRIDAYFAADEPEMELQYRRSLLRLLADLRPQVAELLGGPRNSQ